MCNTWRGRRAFFVPGDRSIISVSGHGQREPSRALIIACAKSLCPRVYSITSARAFRGKVHCRSEVRRLRRSRMRGIEIQGGGSFVNRLRVRVGGKELSRWRRFLWDGGSVCKISCRVSWGGLCGKISWKRWEMLFERVRFKRHVVLDL